MRTARSRTSGEYLGVLALFIMAPFSWKKEPPQNPGRFKMLAEHAAELGASGVVGIRMLVVGEEMVAYGTAVIFW
jgi:hypothetical protein